MNINILILILITKLMLPATRMLVVAMSVSEHWNSEVAQYGLQKGGYALLSRKKCPNGDAVQSSAQMGYQEYRNALPSPPGDGWEGAP